MACPLPRGLQMASVRAEKKFPPSISDNPEEQVKPLLDWANGGFLPKGEEGLKPTHTAGKTHTHTHTGILSCCYLSLSVFACTCTDSNPLDHQVLDVSLPDYFPSAKRPRVGMCKSKSGPEESYSRGTGGRGQRSRHRERCLCISADNRTTLSNAVGLLHGEAA